MASFGGLLQAKRSQDLSLDLKLYGLHAFRAFRIGALDNRVAQKVLCTGRSCRALHWTVAILQWCESLRYKMKLSLLAVKSSLSFLGVYDTTNFTST